MTDAYGYAEAMLKQGAPYSAAAMAAGLSEARLREERPGYGERESYDQFSPIAAKLPDMSDATLRKTLALSLRLLSDRIGLPATRQAMDSAWNALPEIAARLALEASVSPPGLMARVCTLYGVTPEELRGPGKKYDLATARHHLMALLRQHTTLSTTAIGRFLGGRDHSTVVNGLCRHKERVASNDKRLRHDVR